MANGSVPLTQLAEVEPGILLELNTAKAYLAAKKEYPGLRIASPAGGYRDLATQAAMRNPANAGKYNLDPASVVTLAKPGFSTHGLGTRVDIVTTARTWAINNLARFGFDREFGSKDPGHFRFNGTISGATTMTKEQVKLIATYLNTRGLGKTTTSNIDGIPGSVYWTLIQLAGQKDGLYPAANYKVDGKPGAKTYELEKHYLERITVPTPPIVVAPPVPTTCVTKAEVAAMIAAIPKPPSKEEIATEVIRLLKNQL